VVHDRSTGGRGGNEEDVRVRGDNDDGEEVEDVGGH
jgi:hypothetical protein